MRRYSTGESAESGLELAPGMRVDDFVSTTREMLLGFIKNHFPVHIADVAAAPAPGDFNDGGFNEGGADLDFAQPPQPSGTPGALREDAECVAARDTLLEMGEALELPPNFLDELIDELGGPGAVAEMTGRRGRVVRPRAGGTLVFEARGEGGGSKGRGRAAAGSIAGDGEVEGVNLQEKEAFNKVGRCTFTRS